MTSTTQRAPEQAKCTCCGKPFPASDSRARCRPCRQARQPSDWQRRRDIADSRLPAPVRELLLERLATGEPINAACAALGTTPSRARGWAAFDPDWQQRLDNALTAGRDPGLDHGTIGAYRWGFCRCPECRQARAALG